jgi:phospholipid/cholesterol/gamma-HCH transport system substrate-binding protein
VASMTVLLVAAGFSLYTIETNHGPVMNGVTMHARFVSANGLAAGARVDLAGVAVGKVSAVTLDPVSQMARVDFTVDPFLHLPADTVIGIGAPTMTADTALEIVPGHAAQILLPGATITDTREPISLEQQVSDYIFGGSLAGQ